MGNPLKVEVHNWENHENKSPLPRLITRGGRQKIWVSIKIGGLPKKPTTYLIRNCQYKIRYCSMEYDIYIYACNIKSTSVHIDVHPSKKGMINFIQLPPRQPPSFGTHPCSTYLCTEAARASVQTIQSKIEKEPPPSHAKDSTCGRTEDNRNQYTVVFGDYTRKCSNIKI